MGVIVVKHKGLHATQYDAAYKYNYHLNVDAEVDPAISSRVFQRSQ